QARPTAQLPLPYHPAVYVVKLPRGLQPLTRPRIVDLELLRLLHDCKWDLLCPDECRTHHPDNGCLSRRRRVGAWPRVHCFSQGEMSRHAVRPTSGALTCRRTIGALYSAQGVLFPCGAVRRL